MYEFERFRFAALRLSNGDLRKLEQAVELAKRDWRDLLMAAGFGEDVTAHERWRPTRPRTAEDVADELRPQRDERLQQAESRWFGVTKRRCPNCAALCPEYRPRCWVCGHGIGRVTT